MGKFFNSGTTIVIICVKNCLKLPICKSVKVLLSLSASAIAFTPSTPIKVKTKIIINGRIIN